MRLLTWFAKQCVVPARDAEKIANELKENFGVNDESNLAHLFSINSNILKEITSAKYYSYIITKQLRDILFVELKLFSDEQIKTLFQNSNFDFQFCPGVNGYVLINLKNTAEMQNILIAPQKEAILSAALSFIADLTVNGVDRSKLIKEEWRRSRYVRIEGDEYDEVIDLTGDMDGMMVSNKRVKVERTVVTPPLAVSDENAPLRELFDLWQKGDDLQNLAKDTADSSNVVRRVERIYSSTDQSVKQEVSLSDEENEEEEEEEEVWGSDSEEEDGVLSREKDEDVDEEVNDIQACGAEEQSEDSDDESESSMPPLVPHHHQHEHQQQHQQRPRDRTSDVIAQLRHQQGVTAGDSTRLNAFLQSDLARQLPAMLSDRRNESLLEAVLSLSNDIAQAATTNTTAGHFLVQTGGVVAGILKHILSHRYNMEKIRTLANGLLAYLCGAKHYQKELLEMGVVERIVETHHVDHRKEGSYSPLYALSMLCKHSPLPSNQEMRAIVTLLGVELAKKITIIHLDYYLAEAVEHAAMVDVAMVADPCYGVLKPLVHLLVTGSVFTTRKVLRALTLVCKYDNEIAYHVLSNPGMVSSRRLVGILKANLTTADTSIADDLLYVLARAAQLGGEQVQWLIDSKLLLEVVRAFPALNGHSHKQSVCLRLVSAVCLRGSPDQVEYLRDVRGVDIISHGLEELTLSTKDINIVLHAVDRVAGFCEGAGDDPELWRLMVRAGLTASLKVALREMGGTDRLHFGNSLNALLRKLQDA